MPLKDRPIKRGQRMPAERLEALRVEAVAGRNIRPGTNIVGLQSGAGASSISANTLPELAEVSAVMAVVEWDAELPAPWRVGNLTKMTDATTGAVLYYRCIKAHTSNGVWTPGTLGGAGHWVLVHTPYRVYILDSQSGAQTHDYEPVYIADGGLAVPQFTRGYLGTGASGDKFMLPSTLGGGMHGEWYWFNEDVGVAANWTTPLKVFNDASGYGLYYPESPPGIITKVRAAAQYPALALVGITGGQIAVYARTGTQVDTRDDGEVDVWTNSASLVTLDATHNTNRNMQLVADGLSMVITDGDAVGVKMVTSVGFTHNSPSGFTGTVGLFIEER